MISPYEARIRATAGEALAIRDLATGLVLGDMLTLVRYGLYDQLTIEFEELALVYRQRLGKPPANQEEDQDPALRGVVPTIVTKYETRLHAAAIEARAARDSVNGELLEDLIGLVQHGRYRAAQNLFQFLGAFYRDRLGEPPASRDDDGA